MSNYVISDIHGHYDLFKEMLDKIHFSETDHLYILGDLIDKGPEPIKLIFEIMNMKNVTFLIGNHEKMMLEAIEDGDYVLWYNNSGYYTESLIDQLDEVQYKNMMHFINRAPYYKEIVVNDQKFFLSHAEYINVHDETVDTKFINDILIWGRNRNFPPEDIIAICGHTPTNHREFYEEDTCPTIYKEQNYIDIDCGCAGLVFGLPGQLSCLKLEDMQEFYVKPTEEYLAQFTVNT